MDNDPDGHHLKAREPPLRLSESRHRRSPAVISMPTHHNSARPLTHPRTATGSVLGAGYPSNRFGLRVLVSAHFSGQFLLTQTVTFARSADFAVRVGMVPDFKALPEASITLA